MTRKYRVFISSSYEDLKEARQELIKATLREGHIPFGMEMLKATPERGLDVIEQHIRDSDIFSILVGARLGSQIDGKPGALTFTEYEYELALKHGLPVIAFLLVSDEVVGVLRKLMESKILSDHELRELDNRLKGFRKRVQDDHIVEFFSLKALDKLTNQYSGSLTDVVANLEKRESPGGWVKGKEYDEVKKRIALDPVVSENPFFQQLLCELARFGKISVRTTVGDKLKRDIASYFWRRYFAKLYEKNIRAVFFESGSSIAYVSREFIEQVKSQSKWFYARQMNKRLKIRTNNLLTYLDFLMRDSTWQPMDVRVQPPGPFSADYGATYGVLSSAVEQAAPSLTDPVRKYLPKEIQKYVDQLTNELRRDFERAGLVLMTASGLDTRPKSKEAPYPGPHVGSYYNTLLKRSLLALKCPKVLFLHPYKWGFEFKFHNCHAVCDESFPWEQLKFESPLAIALAAENREGQDKLARELSDYGFTQIDVELPAAGTTGPWSVIAANRQFADFFGGSDVVH